MTYITFWHFNLDALIFGVPDLSFVIFRHNVFFFFSSLALAIGPRLHGVLRLMLMNGSDFKWCLQSGHCGIKMSKIRIFLSEFWTTLEIQTNWVFEWQPCHFLQCNHCLFEWQPPNQLTFCQSK